jgi:hypothetical protein
MQILDITPKALIDVLVDDNGDKTGVILELKEISFSFEGLPTEEAIRLYDIIENDTLYIMVPGHNIPDEDVNIILDRRVQKDEANEMVGLLQRLFFISRKYIQERVLKEIDYNMLRNDGTSANSEKSL